MMGKVFCLGELLLRISPELNRQWLHDARVALYVGGAELNVATALSNWNIPTRYCTALPDNYLSKEITEEITTTNIDTSFIHVSGSRLGIYYLPQGAEIQYTGVIYDRAESSFASLKPGMINWHEALADCSWFHVSAISPALSDSAAMVCKEAIEVAHQKGLTISIDLNYRAKLWQYGKQPANVMHQLMPYCDVVMGNIWSAEQLLHIPCPVKESKGKTIQQLTDAAIDSARQLQAAYKNLKTIAYTFRLHEIYFSTLLHQNVITSSKIHTLKNIVDKVGSGDCYMAGLIYGLYNQLKPNEIVEFAVSAAAGKMQEHGDRTRQTIEMVKNNISSQ